MIKNWLHNWITAWPEARSFRVLNDIGAVIGTDRGPIREQNQDRAAIMKYSSTTSEGSYICAVVADGMGGMKDGAGCAARAIAAFLNALLELREKTSFTQNLESAAHAANDHVYSYLNGKGGSTLSAVLVNGSGLIHWVNIGDSRIYISEDENNERKQLRRFTVDDTLEEAFGGHGRDLLQYVGIGGGLPLP